jgi:hypothetical protein
MSSALIKYREQAREFGGVVIILLYTLFIYPFSYPSSGKGKGSKAA